MKWTWSFTKLERKKIIFVGIGILIFVLALKIFFYWDDADSNQTRLLKPNITSLHTTNYSPPSSLTSNSVLSLVGTVEAGEIVSVIAPFDATIKEKFFSFGQESSRGQLLLLLDTTELKRNIQESKVAMLKAERTLRELVHWESGVDVIRAQRSVTLAQQQVGKGERNVREAESLLKKGIIPRVEYEGLVEQLQGYQGQLSAALEDLTATREKANKSSLEIARIEYMSAKEKYESLRNSLVFEKIKAPQAGIISKTPTNSGQTTAVLEVGSRISKGQLLFNVASTDKLVASVKVDETDIADLVPGMKAQIFIDAPGTQTIEGHLAEISAQAIQNGGISQNATFDIKIALPELSEQQRRHLRVGMSCNISIEKYPQDIDDKPSIRPNPV